MIIRSRISTGQYENSTMTEECEAGLTLDEMAKRAKMLDDAHHAAFQEKPENTLPDADMTQFIYGMIYHTPIHTETYEQMNPAQKTFVNQLKKALARKTPSHSQPQTKKDPIDAKVEY